MEIKQHNEIWKELTTRPRAELVVAIRMIFWELEIKGYDHKQITKAINHTVKEVIKNEN